MGQKLTDRTALTSIATGDLFHVVDVSDTTDSAEGTSKKITQDNLIPDASATVKGKVELATSAETITGTDTARAVTPAGAAAAIAASVANYQPLDSDLTAFASHPTYITTLNINPLFAPQGFLINGKISVTDAAGITVAIKTLAGNDPSASDPVYVRIGDTVRTISSALSVSKADGTNWLKAGSAELATKEIDYFVYLFWDSVNSAVKLGFSRFPGAAVIGDFNVNQDNEKGICIEAGGTLTAADTCELIGRFAATLSAGAGYTWSVPTYTAINLIQRPIYETRFLLATMVLTGFSSELQTSIAYKISGRSITLFGVSPGYIGGTSNATGFTATLPFSSGATTYFEGVPLRVQDNGADQTGAGLARIVASSATMTLYKTLLQGTWTATNGKYFYMLPITYEI